MAKKRRSRKRYSEEQRTKILAAATKEGLTAAAVQKRFGVTPVTYYSWRRKTGVGRGRGSATAKAQRGGPHDSQLRGEIQARIRQVLPELVRAEISNYLDSALGARSRRGGRK